MTPRPYLSWNQYDLFGKSKEGFRKLYMQGKTFSNPYTVFGNELALMREKEEYPDDLENIRLFLPHYPKREYVMTAQIRIDGKQVMLLGRFDGVDLRRHIIGDDKTGLATHVTAKGNISKEWDQKRADKSEQVTFYSFIYWKKKRVIPKFRIHWLETREKNKKVFATGRVETFETTRTMKELLLLSVKISERWRGIIQLCEEEWSKVL